MGDEVDEEERLNDAKRDRERREEVSFFIQGEKETGTRRKDREGNRPLRRLANHGRHFRHSVAERGTAGQVGGVFFTHLSCVSSGKCEARCVREGTQN